MHVDEPVADVESVYQKIKSLIVAREVRPNQHLALRPVANMFDTSATTVREALIRLAAEGLISHHSHRGFYVHALDFREMRDRYNLLYAVLKYCIETGIGNFDSNSMHDDIRFYLSKSDRISRATPYSVETHVHRIEGLYRHLAGLSDNRVILEMLDTFCDATRYIRQLNLSDLDQLQQIEHSISEMIVFLAGGQAGDAVEALRLLVDKKIERLPTLVNEGNAKSLMAPPLYRE